MKPSATRRANGEPGQGVMTMRSSTTLTPGADQAARLASSFSNHELTLP